MPARGDEGSKPLRLFIAIDVPGEVRLPIDEVVTPWRERYPGGRWVPSENRHVTLKFLGSTSPELVGWVGSAVAQVAAGTRPLRSRVEGLGAFPSARRARVLWAGLEDSGGAMRDLAAALDLALEREFVPEQRGFTPHLTLARFDPPVELGEALGREVAWSGPFLVDHFTLYRSRLRRPAPLYEPLAVFPLAG